MWLLDDFPSARVKERYGSAPDAAFLAGVQRGAARLANGCSASFVSPDGLVMTNHHCARACITAVSPPVTHCQRTGFVARTGAQERKCPELYVDQLQSIEDVTARVRGAVTATAPAAQVEQRNGAIERIQQECAAATGLTCQVVTF